jgi:hypothetical protein
MRDIDRLSLKDIRWKEARWNCPHCGKDPEIASERLEWVAENGGQNFEATTYFVGPVTAHKVLKPDYLVRSSTEFNSLAEFSNQVLGETAEESSSQLIASDIEEAFHQGSLDSSELHCLGADMGQMCYVTIGRMTSDGTLLVVHYEAIPLSLFEVRRRELCAQYRVVTSVHDTLPESHLITRITESDPNAWGAIFTAGGSEIFTTQQRVANAEEGKLNLRLVKIRRTIALDKLLELFKKKKVVIARNSESSRFMTQMLSLKRQQEFVKDELTWLWKKSDYNDHYHFSLMYLSVACQLRAAAGSWTTIGAVPLLVRFRPGG